MQNTPDLLMGQRTHLGIAGNVATADCFISLPPERTVRSLPDGYPLRVWCFSLANASLPPGAGLDFHHVDEAPA
jgi:hypothetical protein